MQMPTASCFQLVLGDRILINNHKVAAMLTVDHCVIEEQALISSNQQINLDKQSISVVQLYSGGILNIS